MATFQTSNGYTVLIDDQDLHVVGGWRWYGNDKRKDDSLVYVQRVATSQGRRTTQYFHREIMKAVAGQEVDHVNGNTLDNRRQNLRVCSHEQNMKNKRVNRRSKTGFLGVVPCRSGLFKAVVGRKECGVFRSVEDAALARDAAAVLEIGEFARLNFPDRCGQPIPTEARSVRAKTGFRGVNPIKNGFGAQYRGKHVGYALDPVEAARMYDAAVLKQGTTGTRRLRLNFPEDHKAMQTAD